MNEINSAVELLQRLSAPLEAISNLAYLTLEEADDSKRVRMYMHLAQTQFAAVAEIASSVSLPRESRG